MWRAFSWRLWNSVAPRGIALFLGLFALLNVVGEARSPGFDANLWWIKLPVNWRHVDCGILGWSACCLLWFASHRHFIKAERLVLSATFTALLIASLGNVVGFYQLLSSDAIQSQAPIPFSLVVASCLGIFTACAWFQRETSDLDRRSTWLYRIVLTVTCVMSGLLFPVAQMLSFGWTDYRRPADVIVVWGAKVHGSGQLSSILEERVRTGCELYHQQLAPRILFSGGPGVGAIHEAEGMRRRAIELNVPESAIILDTDGLDTDATAMNTLTLARQRGWTRILAVSQFYHLPRIKLAFHRRGSEVYTVPAMRLYEIRYMPYFMLREIAAWWVYYLRPLWSPQ